MKKSVKILVTAILVGLAVVMTSCAGLTSSLAEAGNLNGRTYVTTLAGGTSVRFNFLMESGKHNYVLNVYINGVQDYEYEWMLDPGENDFNAKDIKIYRNSGDVDTEVIGILRPDDVNPQHLTVISDYITVGTLTETTVAIILKDKVFDRVN